MLLLCALSAQRSLANDLQLSVRQSPTASFQHLKIEKMSLHSSAWIWPELNPRMPTILTIKDFSGGEMTEVDTLFELVKNYALTQNQFGKKLKIEFKSKCASACTLFLARINQLAGTGHVDVYFDSSLKMQFHGLCLVSDRFQSRYASTATQNFVNDFIAAKIKPSFFTEPFGENRLPILSINKDNCRKTADLTRDDPRLIQAGFFSHGKLCSQNCFSTQGTTERRRIQQLGLN